ncbi:MAG: agmatinase [archaeon]
MRFMDLADEYSGENSFFSILPIEYEKDVTYGKGASKGPKEIIKASQHLEYYDEQFYCEPFLKGIKTLEAVEEVKELSNNFTIALGGDHSITIGVVDKLLEKEDFSVIVLDAHSDMRHSWNNSKYNHACTSKRISEKTSIGLIGIRSQDIDEAKEIKKNKDIHQIKAYEFNEEKLFQLLKKLKNKVYISIDVDVFDPSFIRNTGTPEPGGFTWNEVINILQKIFKEKEVIGADIVEFAPNINFEAEAYSLAKLAYKLMSLKLSL